ncbi:tRNA glutamyl-Q(34) synthetase GluQRS [Aureimonas mangrovi]|uniref:tRNA glutamyl-Q(34) synthetase GluQRS n=1 Tax=Aureimonas mangrovi TaxID=2758041 RepID=UPI00163DD1AB|nr:tRNA glutamyl-Q(34) synthetase GluQRS [Aureimonas mangrovi]
MTEPGNRVFRFAPSPNGALHLGHAYSALLNHDLSREAGGRLLLRMEDIDRARCSRAFETAIVQDLEWLGVEYARSVRRQSEHFEDYLEVIEALAGEGLVYPGFMTRGEVRAYAARHEEATGTPWPRDPDGALLYPALDRNLPEGERAARIAGGEPFAWRLDMERALGRTGDLVWTEAGGDEGGVVDVAAEPALWGDVVLGRKDVPTSYHLAVVVDDALQGITDVVRGRDLLPATSVHRVLQFLLGLPAPVYHHHRLVLGGDGRKLSKSAGDTSLATARAAGMSPRDIRRMVGL